MKIVFLDIDGVLNSTRFMIEFDRRRVQEKKTFRFEDQIDPDAVTHLNALLIATKAVVVVSSSWRRLVDLDELERILRNHGFLGSIFGTTPDLSHLDRSDRPLWRGDEIQHWLDHHPRRVESFVILDDGSDMGDLKPRLVQTDPDLGLTQDDVLAATAILNG